MSTFDSSTQTSSNTFETVSSEPQGPVPAPCPQGGHSPARPSSSAVSVDAADSERHPLNITATYDAADNKIRLRAAARLSAEIYQRVKAAGFAWAPRQQLFIAPMWTPAREDLAIELAGELGDEDTSLVERAEERADRFEGYSERRAADADAARRAVEQVSQRFEFGQPIVVAHHSERKARKDAERIQDGMRKAVKMWETSSYWQARAAAALRHAEHKERPGVRARRIKTLEAEQRSHARTRTAAVTTLTKWGAEGLTMDRALRLAGDPGLISRSQKYSIAEYPRPPEASQYEGERSTWSALDERLITAEQARDQIIPACRRVIAHEDRWLAHLANRIGYERAMLAEDGGLPGAQFPYAVGGRVLRRGSWYPITKVNVRNGQPMSVTVAGHFASTITFDEVTDYRPPADGDAEKVKAAIDRGPMCNYPGEGFVHMTSAEWKALPRWTDGKYTERHKATEKHGRHRTKCRPMPSFTTACVYITDAKRVDPPAPAAAAAPVVQVEREGAAIRGEIDRLATANAAREARAVEAAPFEALKTSLKAGVTVVVADQLFPTPPDLAAAMVQAVDVQPGDTVLEPSAGTGSLVRAVLAAQPTATLTAVEIDPRLVTGLRHTLASDDVRVVGADFLAVATTLGTFDRIIMNPPFSGGQDVAHILRAMAMLKPGGRLVALCADGPRQRDRLKSTVETMDGQWTPLGDAGFAGTSVRVAMLMLTASP